MRRHPCGAKKSVTCAGRVKAMKALYIYIYITLYIILYTRPSLLGSTSIIFHFPRTPGVHWIRLFVYELFAKQHLPRVFGALLWGVRPNDVLQTRRRHRRLHVAWLDGKNEEPHLIESLADKVEN